MRKTTQKVLYTDELIGCDVCGRDLYVKTSGTIGEYNASTHERDETLILGGTGGCGSLIGHGVTWELDLCQHCFHEAFGKYIRIINDGDL